MKSLLIHFLKQLIKLILPRKVLNILILITYWVHEHILRRPGRNVRKVLDKLNVRSLRFFKQKTPTSECFPYSVHYPNALENIPKGLEAFYLIGSNWQTAVEKPFALGFGFNDWKFGFISEYLIDHRVAFAPRKHIGFRARLQLWVLKEKPKAIFVWGYTTQPWLEVFAKRLKIPFVRIEDGFVRSSKLGAAHTTPYSLVFDDLGMHYNLKTPSRLEKILTEYDFANDKPLIQQAKQARNFLIQNCISKYNPPSIVDPKEYYTVKTRKRILVIGQVDTDASIRLGNPDNWSMEDLVRLARLENQDAEIFYKPHPDIYAGYQKSLFREWRVKNFATVIPPNVSLISFLDNVDHVYTITSLSGFEAIIRNVKVTVVGTPFYAGWGHTDDRANLEPRNRSLSVDELFAAVYLKYPKYLADLNDSSTGFHATCLRILADREIALPELITGNIETQEQINTLASAPLWPKLMLDPAFKTPKLAPLAQASVPHINVERFFQNCKGERAKKAVAFMIAGWIEDDQARNVFLKKIQTLVSLETFNVLTLELSIYRPGPYLIQHFSWLLSHYDDPRSSTAYVSLQIANDKADRIRKSEDVLQTQNIAPLETIIEGEIDPNRITPEQSSMLYDLAAAQLEETKYKGAEETMLTLLANGYTDSRALVFLANISKIKFDFSSCYALASLLFSLGEKGPAHKAITFIADTAYTNGSESYLKDLATYLSMKPEKLVNVQIELQREKEGIDETQVSEALMHFLNMDNDLSIPKAQGLLAANDPNRAIEVVESLLKTHINTAKLSVIYSQALTFANRTPQAEQVIDNALCLFKTSLVYRETLRVCILLGKYDKGLRILKEAQGKHIELGDMTPRKIYYGARMPYEAHQTFQDFPLKNEVRRHYEDKYCNDVFSAKAGRKFFGIPIFGPGDEIRFASIYGKLSEDLPHKEIKMACNPRLFPMMKRSFPKIKFVGVNRLRNSDAFNRADYDKVKNSILIGGIDNSAVECIEKCDDLVLVTDLLANYTRTYDTFPGGSYLKANSAKVKKLKARLPKEKPLVGLSWRSSLTTHSRIEHYLSIEELAPIFELDHVQFVNLQYDECSEELAWIEKNYPGKIINLEDIDQYNDFDTVSALMKCMDLVVSPATTVVELAGALGCPTWLLSNSSEIHWRKQENSLTDVWHPSITHIEGAILKNKASLVQNLRKQLKSFK